MSEETPVIEEMFVELTPEQEAIELVKEFNDFAGSVEQTIPFIPEDKSDVKEKVERLVTALQSFDEQDMLMLFRAMDASSAKFEDIDENPNQ